MRFLQTTLLGTLCLVLATALPAHAKKIAGVSMPDTMQAGDTQLTLNGAGIRTKFMMDIYVGGLYLTAKSRKSEAIIAANEPMAIKLHMVSGMITSEAMEEATMDGFKNTTGGNMTALAKPIDEFVAVFREPIAVGDIFDIVNIPAKGVDIYKNGAFKGTVQGGLEFKQAVFGIWLGDKPAHKKLKSGMLGK